MSLKINKTVGRSFRINEQWLNILGDEADKAHISPNALLNKILGAYCQFDRFLERYGAITLDQKSFSRIIQACPKESVEEIAGKAGSVVALNIFRTMGLRTDYDGATFFVETVLAKYANWFKCERFTAKDKDTFHLSHDLGDNWSIYVAEVVSAIIEQCCGRKVKKDFLEGAVTLEVSAKHIGNLRPF